MVRSFLALQAKDPGFDSRSVLTAELAVAGEDVGDPTGRLSLIERVLSASREVPGVTLASATSRLPASGSNEVWELVAEASTLDTDEATPTLVQEIAGPYFDAMGVRLLSGRSFTETEMREGGKVVVLSEGLAQSLFGTTDAVGRRVRAARSAVPDEYLVVGVVGDVDIGSDMVDMGLPRVQLYQPYAQSPGDEITLVVKGEEDPGRLASSLRGAIRRAAPGIPLSEILTMDDAIFRVRWVSLFFSRQLAGYAALAVFITLFGTYGLTADSVVRRTRELAIRFALGASERGLVSLVLKEAVILAAAGVALGILLALALGQLVSTMFVTVSPRDPFTLAAVSSAVFLATLLAAFLPARLALRMDPTTALRTE
jgi:hypothetical protein